MVARAEKCMADVVERFHPTIGDDGGHALQSEIGDDPLTQHLEAERRRVGAELVAVDAVVHRLDHGQRQRMMIGVLPHPAEARRVEQPVEIPVARFEVAHLCCPCQPATGCASAFMCCAFMCLDR